MKIKMSDWEPSFLLGMRAERADCVSKIIFLTYHQITLALSFPRVV